MASGEWGVETVTNFIFLGYKITVDGAVMKLKDDCSLKGDKPSVCESVGRRVVSDSATQWNVAHQAPLSMGFSRQEYWSV